MSDYNPSWYINLTQTDFDSTNVTLRGRLFPVVGVDCKSFNFSVNFGPDGFMYSHP